MRGVMSRFLSAVVPSRARHPQGRARLRARLRKLVVEGLEDRRLMAFTPGNLVINQIGDGVSTTTDASTAITLVEYTTAGAATGMNIAIPAASALNASNGLTDSGNENTNGQLDLSADGSYLSLIGYAEPAVVTAVNTLNGVNRNVARVNTAGTVQIRAGLTDAFQGTSNNPRAAATTDGNTFWVGGNAGVRYVADTTVTATTSTSVTSTGSTRDVSIATDASNNRFLFQTTQTAASFYSTSLPTGTATPISLGATLLDAEGIIAFDRNPTVGATGLGGIDTIYVADGSVANTGSGVLRKFEWGSGTWNAMGTSTVSGKNTRLFGLTGRVVGNNVELYATTVMAATGVGGNQLVAVTDTTGFGGVLSASMSTIAVASANRSFRGVAFAPTSSPVATTITYGNNATLSVAPGTAPATTLQWQTLVGSTWTNIGAAADGGVYSNFTTNTLTLTKPPVSLSTRNYRVVYTNSNGTTNSNPATLTVNTKSLSASGTASNKVYNGTTAATVSITLAGIVAGDTVTGSATGTFDTKNVGTGKTVTIGTVTLSGASAANYSVSSAGTTTADITKFGLTASGTASNKVYDSTSVATVSIALSGVFGGDTVSGTASGSFADKNVGTAKTVTIGAVTLAGGDAGNYSVGSAGTTTANITPLGITASGSGVNKVYDATTAASVLITLSGVLGGDTVSGSASGSFTNKDVGALKTITIGTVNLSGTDAANYSVGSAGSTTADITPFGLSASGTASNKVYDGNTAATVGISLTGVFAGDIIAGSAAGTFDTKNVGAGKTVTIGSVTLAGTDSGNYTVGPAGTTTANVTPAPLSASAVSKSKTIGDADPLLSFTASGFVPGESAANALTGGLTRDAGEAVGLYGIHQGSLSALNGNYAISFTDGTLTILDVVKLASTQINGGAAQRSLLTTIVVNFNTPVTLDPNALSITNIGLTSVQSVPLAQAQILISPAPGTQSSSFTITFGAGSGVITRTGGNSLVDGNYRLDVDGTKVTDGLGRKLPGTASFGTVSTDNFFRLYGDIDGNGAVDSVDYAAAKAAFKLGGTYNPLFDINGNGILEASEGSALTANVGKRRRTY